MTYEQRKAIREARSKAKRAEVGRVRCECGHCDTCRKRQARREGRWQ